MERESTSNTMISLQQRHVNLMTSAKAILDMDPFDDDDEDSHDDNEEEEEKHDKEYHHIVRLMEKYIQKHCEHVIEYDEIDIDPDRSKSIRYCTRCMLTFK